MEAQSERGNQHIRAQLKNNEYTATEEERLFDPEALMKHILKTTLLNIMQRHLIRKHRKQVDVFEKAMDSIKASTGISGMRPHHEPFEGAAIPWHDTLRAHLVNTKRRPSLRFLLRR